MSIAHAFPAVTRLLALAAVRLARAQLVFRRRRNRHGDPSAGAVLLGSAMCSCASNDWPPRCRRPMPISCAAKSMPTTRRSTMRRQNTILRARHIHDVLRQEPFDVEAMRAAMAKTRAARLAFDQTIQGVFANIAAKISPAGRQALANWPPGRKTRQRQTVVVIAKPSRCLAGI